MHALLDPPAKNAAARKTRPRVMPCPVSRAAARDCPHCAHIRRAWSGKLPKATLEALRETEDMIAHPEKYPGMTLEQYLAWAHSV